MASDLMDRKASERRIGREESPNPAVDDRDNDEGAPLEMQVFTYVDVMDDFVYLKDTYVVDEAPHSVNISSKLRKRLIANTTQLRTKCLELDKLHEALSQRASIVVA